MSRNKLCCGIIPCFCVKITKVIFYYYIIIRGIMKVVLLKLLYCLLFLVLLLLGHRQVSLLCHGIFVIVSSWSWVFILC